MSTRKNPKPTSRKFKAALAQQVPIFPSGIVYNAMPAGARNKPALWKRKAGPARLSSGAVIELLEDTMKVDMEGAIETEANMRLTEILASGKLPSAEDFERCATKPPMSGPRLFNLMVSLGSLSAQQWRRFEVVRKKARSAHMLDLARRKRKPRNGKWSKAVRDEAEARYIEWCAATKETRGKHGNLWGTKWKDFAPICITKIKNKTGVDVTEDQLRRSILPVKNHPRPT